MMRFIDLCWLLATVQLLLVSAEVIPLPEGINVTFSLPGNVESCTKYGCGNTESCVSELSQEDNNVLTLNNLGLSDSGTYCCQTSNDDCSLELKVVRGCIKSFLKDVEFTQPNLMEISGITKVDCMNACTCKKDCQYFTFTKSNSKCSLMESKPPLKISRKTDTISGYSCKSSSTTYFNNHNSQSESAGNDSVQSNLTLQFHNDTRNWFAALGFCRQQNHTLVQLTKDTMLKKVEQLIGNKTTTQNEAWVGLERHIFGCDTSWRWISGGNVSFPQWNGSTAPSSSNKYCGKVIWVNETTIKLVEDDCFKDLPFICQSKLLY